MFILTLISFIAILFAFVVFFTTPVLRNAQQNYLFLSLLATWLCMVVNVAFTQGYSTITNSWIFLSGYGCTVTGFINQMACGLEIYSLMCLAIERYYAIIRGKALLKKDILIMVTVGWITQPFLAR
jgi:hypothetical protein